MPRAALTALLPLLALLVPAAANAADDVQLTLQGADVYVSSVQLGPAATDARRELAVVAVE